MFNGVTREPRTNDHYEGGSHGVSIRLMKGVSYNGGAVHRLSTGDKIQNKMKPGDNADAIAGRLSLEIGG
jgi:hypothetical protein